jgi:hypothetical protein
MLELLRVTIYVAYKGYENRIETIERTFLDDSDESVIDEDFPPVFCIFFQVILPSISNMILA